MTDETDLVKQDLINSVDAKDAKEITKEITTIEDGNREQNLPSEIAGLIEEDSSRLAVVRGDIPTRRDIKQWLDRPIYRRGQIKGK